MGRRLHNILHWDATRGRVPRVDGRVGRTSARAAQPAPAGQNAPFVLDAQVAT
jgi:hypothetical protein